MRYLLISFLLFVSVPPAAEEFTTDAAKAAKAAYEADLKAAKEKYAKALDEAAKQAVADGDFDEVLRIKKVKERLEGKQSNDEPEKEERVLWKHRAGYFEKLNDGHWIERGPAGGAYIFAQSTESDEYIELNRSGVLVRLYDTKTEILRKGDRGFKPHFKKGEWVPRP